MNKNSRSLPSSSNRAAPRRLAAFTLVSAVLAFGAATPSVGRAEDERTMFKNAIEQRADAVVSIKLVLKIKGGPYGPEGQELEQETTGLMIDPSGLVLAPSNEMGGIPPALKPFLSQMGEFSVEPRDVKVLIGNDPTEFEAEICARDSEIDLVWVRLKNPDGKKFAAQDLADGADCRIGQKLVIVDRMSKYFDRAPIVEEFRIAGITAKPRRLFVPNKMLGSGFCTPIYAADGKFVGVKILQLPEMDDPISAMSQMGDMQTLMSGFILPAKDLQEATVRALAAATTEPAAAPAASQPAAQE